MAFPGLVDPWYARVAALGHGKQADMTPDEAIDVARVNQPGEPDGWSSEAQNVGVRRGDWVSVTPDDYGNPVHGNLLAWTADEIVIRHKDRSVGDVNLHFPRVGFDVVSVEKEAA
jgi:glutathione S-transferase